MSAMVPGRPGMRRLKEAVRGRVGGVTRRVTGEVEVEPLLMLMFWNCSISRICWSISCCGIPARTKKSVICRRDCGGGCIGRRFLCANRCGCIGGENRAGGGGDCGDCGDCGVCGSTIAPPLTTFCPGL